MEACYSLVWSYKGDFNPVQGSVWFTVLKETDSCRKEKTDCAILGWRVKLMQTMPFDSNQLTDQLKGLSISALMLSRFLSWYPPLYPGMLIFLTATVNRLEPTHSSELGSRVNFSINLFLWLLYAMLIFPSKRFLLFSGSSLSVSHVLSMYISYKFFEGKVLMYASFISLKIPSIV